jgi:uncharacterized membrane protein
LSYPQRSRREAREGLALIAATGLSAIPLLALTVAIDLAAADGRIRPPHWLAVGGPDDARALLGAIVGSVSTVLALIFSVVLLVMSIAMSQLGPRLLRRFVADRLWRVTVGAFVATFLQSLIALLLVRQEDGQVFVPQVTCLCSVAMIVLSFGLLIVYTHQVAVTIQANNVVADVVEDLERAIREALPNRVVDVGEPAGQTVQAQDAAVVAARCETEGAVLSTPMAGYVQHVERRALVIAAARADVVVRLDVRAGQFVMPGSPIAHVLPAGRLSTIEKELLANVQIGRHRTLRQDLEFGIAQVVEIALRALSPAVNDTFTGLTCVDWLGQELRDLALLPRTDWAWRSRSGQIRLIEVPMTFPRMVKTAFDQLRQASTENPAVVIRMCRTLRRLGGSVREPTDRRALRDQVLALRETSSREALASSDREDIEQAAQLALLALAEDAAPT